MAKFSRAHALSALLLAACAASRAPSATTPKPRAEDAAPLDPRAYAPAAGLRWLVDAYPALIFRDSALKVAFAGVLSPERMDAFVKVTGIDLRALEEVVVAGYDLGTLYVTSLPSPDGGRVRARFEERLTGAVVKHPRPSLYRIAGTHGGQPRALVAVDDRVFAFAVGDLTLARVAEAYAERRLKSPTALHGAALAELPSAPSDALALLYVPGPFVDSWASAAHGLLSTALALTVTVRPGGGTTLPVVLTAVGDWDQGEAHTQLEAAWSDLSASSTGRLFGFDQAKNVNIVAHLHQLTWSADLALPQLAAGLRAATATNVSEMFDVQGSAPTGEPTDPRPNDGPRP